MSERIDRRIESGSLVAVTVIILLIVAGAIGVFLWFSTSVPPEPPGATQTGDLPGETARPDEPLMVTLYVPGNGMLSAGPAGVKRHPDAQTQAREALNAVLGGLDAVPSAVLKELKLRSFFLDAEGTGYVDLLAVTEGGIKASAEEELLAVYAIVNTLAQNFEEIRQVRFLIDGREPQTLAGHIDLARAFTKRMDLVNQ
jgi:hypothetical protein